jgi:hypothetical protein
MWPCVSPHVCCGVGVRDDAASDLLRTDPLHAVTIGAVLAGMEESPADEVLQTEGIEALFTLAAQASRRSAIISAGGIRIVMRAMTEQLAAAAVQQHGCALLTRFAGAGLESRRGTIPAAAKTASPAANIEDMFLQALAAIEQHPAHVPVVESALAALRSMLAMLLANSYAKTNIMKIGGARVIEAVKAAFPQLQHIRSSCTVLLEGLYSTPAGLTLLHTNAGEEQSVDGNPGAMTPP